MKTLIIVAHPQLDESVTQQFFYESTRSLVDVTWQVTGEQVDIAKMRQLLLEHDRIIWQFPLYWYSAPALLKQWIDEVLGDTFALAPEYVLAGKQLGLVVTTATSAADFGAGRSEHFTMSEILRPFEAIATKLKMHYLPPFVVHQFAYQTDKQHQRLLIKYQQYLTLTDFSFAARSQWLSERLGNLGQRLDGKDRLVVQAVQERLQDNRDELADLNWTISMMKQEEDNQDG